MSGLEKFQANDAWRTNLKKFLLVEREVTTELKESVQNPERFSLDIAEDFAVILEEKKIPLGIHREVGNVIGTEVNTELSTKEEFKTIDMFRSDEKENNPSNAFQKQRQTLPTVKFANDNISGQTRYSAVAYCNETVYEDQDMSQWQRTSDESFEVMEKMCDKTASDPNSTLFQYLHSDQKDKIIESAKKRSGSGVNESYTRGYDEEAKALQRLLDELRVEEQMQLENESPLKGVDVTQLDDIEAPSRLWENTFTSDTILQTSPVKMVGLLRPSTIIEEFDEDSTSDVSSHISFQSAFKGTQSEVSSSYETAHDSTATSSANNTDRIIGEDLLPNSSKTTKSISSLEESNLLPSIKITHEMQYNEVFQNNDGSNNIDLNESIDLIDLEKTFAPIRNSPHSSILEETLEVKEEILINGNIDNGFEKEKELSDSEDSVIEILSDDEDIQESVERHSVDIKNDNLIATETDQTSTCSRSSDIDDYKENYSNLDKSGEDKSLHFNDTMEEVEYMMKKGMQYLASTNATPKKTSNIVTSWDKPSPLKTKQNTFLLSSSANDRYRSPSPMLHKQKPLMPTSIGKVKTLNTTPKSAEKGLVKPKAINPFTKEIKPFPKLDLFKKPTTTGIPTSANMRQKNLNTKQFSHIVSPIRTYIKNSTNTPLMFTINDVNKNPNSLNSMRELEQESRLYKPNFEAVDGASAKVQGSSSSLPKKAYILSEFKHIVDERTPVTIPGGKQFQKHIETAMLPAVLKHEGKMKLPGARNEGKSSTNTSTHIPRRTDASLADLSVMSGDISMYTIKDAQKF